MHEWGDPVGPAIVCLHGVQGHGRRFRRLAEERLVPAGFRVVAPDLRGHGRSSWAPPWNLANHTADVLETIRSLGLGRASWIGYSFGGRLLLEVLAQAPGVVERAILLDPAVETHPDTAIREAEAERRELVFDSVEEAEVARRRDAPTAAAEALEEEMREHLVRGPDGRFRYRYLQSAVVAAFGEIASPPPPPAATVAALLVAAERSWLVRDADVQWLRNTLGPTLELVRVPGGHIVLWEAYEETADAVLRFLSRGQ